MVDSIGKPKQAKYARSLQQNVITAQHISNVRGRMQQSFLYSSFNGERPALSRLEGFPLNFPKVTRQSKFIRASTADPSSRITRFSVPFWKTLLCQGTFPFVI